MVVEYIFDDFLSNKKIPLKLFLLLDRDGDDRYSFLASQMVRRDFVDFNRHIENIYNRFCLFKEDNISDDFDYSFTVSFCNNTVDMYGVRNRISDIKIKRHFCYYEFGRWEIEIFSTNSNPGSSFIYDNRPFPCNSLYEVKKRLNYLGVKKDNIECKTSTIPRVAIDFEKELNSKYKHFLEKI